MRILLANSYQWPTRVGGAETAVENLAQGLVAAGHEVGILSPERGVAAGPNPDGRITRIRISHSNFASPSDIRSRPTIQKAAWHLAEGWKAANREEARAAIRSFRPDVLHTHNLPGLGPKFWQVAEDLQVPVVHTLHDYYLLCVKTTMFRSGRSCTRRCMECRVLTSTKTWARRSPDLVLGPSQYILDAHLSAGWFEPGMTQRVPNVMPPVQARATHPRPIRAFGYIGRLDPTKGLETLLAAARETPEFKFRVAGQGPLEFVARLKQDAPPNVKFLGFVPDLETFYDGVDALIVPSLWREVAAMVIREAQGRGVPVIGSQVGGIPEFITPGRNGWLFTLGDAGSLVSALHAAATSPPGAAGAQAAADYLASDAPHAVALHRTAYDRVLA